MYVVGVLEAPDVVGVYDVSANTCAAGPERRERAHSLDMFDVCTNYNVQCLSKLTSSAEARAPPSNEAVKKNCKIRALGPPLSKMSKA